MKVPYVKMQGAGNRILVVDERRDAIAPPDPGVIRRLADETTGPGFDQLMWVSAAAAPFAAAYRIFNADGSEVGQCGNGVRCVARLLAEEPGHPQSFILSSPSGPIAASVAADGLVMLLRASTSLAPSPFR